MAIDATASIAPLPTISPVQVKPLVAATSIADQPQVKTSAPQALAYASPIYKFDNAGGISIEIFRDPLTGTVTNQIPSEAVVKKYQEGLLRRGPDGAVTSAAQAQSAVATPAPAPTPAAPAAASAAASSAAAASAASKSVSISV